MKGRGSWAEVGKILYLIKRIIIINMYMTLCNSHKQLRIVKYFVMKQQKRST